MKVPRNVNDVDAEIAPHDPELYRATGLADYIDGLDQVHDEHIEQFHQQGYLAVENVFTLVQMSEAKKAVADLYLGNNDLFNAEPNVFIEPGQAAQPILRKLICFCQYSPCLKALRDDRGIHKVLEGIFGGKRAVVAQEMALQKLPGGREKPWHQDKAYFTQALDTLCIGVWIALDDATLENGCMRIIEGGHHDGAYAHFQRRDWQICDSDMLPQICTGVPLKSGGCLFFHSMLPHGTPMNRTKESRSALQYHYLPADAVDITEQEHKEIWGGDVRNLTC